MEIIQQALWWAGYVIGFYGGAALMLIPIVIAVYLLWIACQALGDWLYGLIFDR